jgi:class 3 adenylate cyclase
VTATAACRTCGTEPLENARYCHGCGSPVEDAGIRAEYKQVTVLFADVVHSMDIASAVGAERLREIMADLSDRCAAVVERYGGTVDKFTGDGIMAVFGAPVALEDHAIRACRAALGIQEGSAQLADEVKNRDDIDLRLRVGLNSGQVIAGEIGSRSLGYTTIGEQVGKAQRMESVSPPGGVMLTASTAQLVDGVAHLGESEMVHIKGTDEPVAAQRLLGMEERRLGVERAESSLVGRQWEMASAEGLLHSAVYGQGAVVAVAGPPGIGKSRLVREVTKIATARGVEVFSAYCESHATDVPFRVVARLLRATTGVGGLDEPVARARVRAHAPDADPEDMLLFEDLLGITDPEVELPKIDPDARRRRLTALVNAASLARETPAVYVIEDAHWIDAVSESMLADFFTVIRQTPSLVLVTYRPEYQGALSRVVGAKTIVLAPLSDPETAALVSQLLGPDPSVGALATVIAEQAAGNPFFAEEMVRDLAERGVLRGSRSAYVSTVDAAEVTVPATVQATIAARIDRLNPGAKRTLSAAAVIGSKFSRDLLETLGIGPVLGDLMGGQFIDQVSRTRQPEYVFHHPLIRTVAYESQLKSDRAEVHRRVAAAIESHDPSAVDENAALIAEHLEAAGDVHAAYSWHMRAGTWLTFRDIGAARLNWERALQIADKLPADDPNRAAMRIAPRTLLCGSGWRGDYLDTCSRFEELRDLCLLTGDNASLAIGMTGLIGDHYMRGRLRDASHWADEQMALVELISDPILTVALSGVACVAKHETAQFADVLQWSDRAIQLAGDDATKGNIFVGSPLAVSLALRGFACWALGGPGWQRDFEWAIATSRATDPISYALVINTIYTPAIGCGVVLPNDRAITEISEALRIAEKLADDVALGLARTALGVALVHRDSTEERAYGLDLLEQLRDMCMNEHYYMGVLHFGDVYIARERARLGDTDRALPRLRSATDQMFNVGQLGAFVPATATLVEVLLQRGDDGDVSEAVAAIDRLASAPLDGGFAPRDVWILRLHALIAATQGDHELYCDYRDRYRDMARTLGFEGHIAWAEAMP